MPREVSTVTNRGADVVAGSVTASYQQVVPGRVPGAVSMSGAAANLYQNGRTAACVRYLHGPGSFLHIAVPAHAHAGITQLLEKVSWTTESASESNEWCYRTRQYQRLVCCQRTCRLFVMTAASIDLALGNLLWTYWPSPYLTRRVIGRNRV